MKVGLPENWQVFEFDPDRLFEALRNEHFLRNKSNRFLQDLTQYLVDQRCSVFVVEHEYIDRDFLDEFAVYYVRCFRPYQKKCRRLHFFQGDYAKSLREVLNGEPHAKALGQKLADQRAYLGFMVVKPLPTAIIGRTVLRPPQGHTSSGDEPEEGTVIRCHRRYTANLAGIDLSLDAVAFQEQDSVVAACATSALWSAFHSTAGEFGHALATPFEITEMATRYLQISRNIPSEGLTIEQMCHAITEVGLEPELRDVWDRGRRGATEGTYLYPLLSAAYGYLRGGIPVLLAVDVRGQGKHAITLLGYSLSPKGPGFDEIQMWNPKARFRTRGSRIVRFFAHDDQTGPYASHDVLPGSTYEGEPHYPLELGTRWLKPDRSKTTIVPISMVVPVYHKIRVPYSTIIPPITHLNAPLRKALDNTDIEWDIFLTSVNAYKREIASSPALKSAARSPILTMQHPRFIWRARVLAGGREACEFLADATDMARSFQFYLINAQDQRVRSRLVMAMEQLRAVWEKSDPEFLDIDRSFDATLDFVKEKLPA